VSKYLHFDVVSPWTDDAFLEERIEVNLNDFVEKLLLGCTWHLLWQQRYDEHVVHLVTLPWR